MSRTATFELQRTLMATKNRIRLIPSGESVKEKVGLFVQQCFTSMGPLVIGMKDRDHIYKIRDKCKSIADKTDEVAASEDETPNLQPLLIAFDDLMSCLLGLDGSAAHNPALAALDHALMRASNEEDEEREMYNQSEDEQQQQEQLAEKKRQSAKRIARRISPKRRAPSRDDHSFAAPPPQPTKPAVSFHKTSSTGYINRPRAPRRV